MQRSSQESIPPQEWREGSTYGNSTEEFTVASIQRDGSLMNVVTTDGESFHIGRQSATPFWETGESNS